MSSEVMEVDVLIIGGGSAGLACAYKLSQLIETHNRQLDNGEVMGQKMDDLNIVVLEKASEIGAHSLSGAVMNPISLQELIPDFKEKNCPLDSEVKEDSVYYLSEHKAIRAPITPPPFHNKGNYIISISKFNRWLAEQCNSKGVQIFPGFAAVEALYEGDRIVGVKTGDKGRDKNGQNKPNFEEGLTIKSQCVVFAEGTRGSLFKKVCAKLDLRKGKNPEVFEEGVKEIIQMPRGTVKAGQVIHTLGFPLSKSIGGTFIYTLPEDRIVLGLVVYLDSKDPLLDPHRELQRLKTHPFIYKMIQGGRVVAYGGKTLPAGGWYSMPKLFGNGWMVCGDSASMVDVQKLKGIHLSMKSGMLAAQTLFEGLQNKDFTEKTLQRYEALLNKSFVKKELYKVRNFHQTLSLGLLPSLPLIALQEITGGMGLIPKMGSHPDAKTTEKVSEVYGSSQTPSTLPKPDGVLFFDKLSSVYLTGTMHDENSPNHLLLKNGDVCSTVCEPQYKSPCTHFCPASVYEMVPAAAAQRFDLKINYTNCIHCKTCDIKCPFENIDWTTPEGGGGPQYRDT